MIKTEDRTFLKFTCAYVDKEASYDIWINRNDISHFCKHFESGTMMYLRDRSTFHLVESIETVVSVLSIEGFENYDT